MRTLEELGIASAATKANGNARAVADGEPYAAAIKVVGVAPILLHRYDDVAVERKAQSAKSSLAKKQDDLESYVYRTATGEIGIPATNVKACLREAARSFQDPRSSRKSARDLVTASLHVEPFLASLGRTTWDAVDVRRAVVQRNAVSRRRPMFQEGWELELSVIVLAPEYITASWLHELITRAGRFTGLGDFRPDFGRFRMDSFTVKETL